MSSLAVNEILPTGCENVEDYLTQVHEFLMEWKPLFQYNAKTDHVILFLKHDHFSVRTPVEWQSFLSSHLSMNDIIQMVKFGIVSCDAPDSLKQFVKRAKSLYLKAKTESIVMDDKLTGEIVRGMNRKKQYEVEKLAQIIANYTKQKSCECVLDIGSGKGYLSHVLAFEYGLNVLAVDHNELVVEKSQMRSDQMGKLLNKKNVVYKAISAHLTTDQVQFEQLMSQTENMKESICLIGLHTCGDLAPSTLQMFLAHKRAKCMVNVGCCYHKVTEDEQEQQPDTISPQQNFGFPLSQFMKKKEQLVLTNGGLVLACNAIEKWDTVEQAVEHFARNAHRCALELFLHEYQGQPRDKIIYAIGGVPAQYCTFEKYAKYALTQLHQKGQIHSQTLIDLLSTSPDILEETLVQFYSKLDPDTLCVHGQIRKLTAFWALRAILGPIMEALIVLDRYQFLTESGGVSADVLRVFDEDISPRNLILVASKK